MAKSWFHSLSPTAQKSYIKAHPNSKYAKGKRGTKRKSSKVGEHEISTYRLHKRLKYHSVHSKKRGKSAKRKTYHRGKVGKLRSILRERGHL